MIKIEDYKGFEIFYNEDSDKFVTTMELNSIVKEPKRASLKALKQEISTFIKLNLEFRPFKILYSRHGGGKIALEVTGIRIDGTLVVSESGRWNSYLKPSELTTARVYDKSYIDTLNDFDLKINKLKQERVDLEKELSSKLIPLDLSKYE